MFFFVMIYYFLDHFGLAGLTKPSKRASGPSENHAGRAQKDSSASTTASVPYVSSMSWVPSPYLYIFLAVYMYVYVLNDCVWCYMCVRLHVGVSGVRRVGAGSRRVGALVFNRITKDVNDPGFSQSFGGKYFNLENFRII